ncbi:MAG TPA: hypothetical protein VMN37_09990 [Gemmatimonadales bacterium]|nr:hypothetical protein [Gemmatimonadales bacterium]
MPFGFNSIRSLTAPVVAMLVGCAVPSQTTRLPVGPDPVTVRLQPAVPRPGQPAELVIESPGADSIVVESLNGIDRYWDHGSRMRVWLGDDFGDAWREGRAAERRDGQLIDRLQRPARILTCRLGRCSELYYEIPLKLAERNSRTVALAAGWSSVFARRAITGGDRTVLFREVLSSGVWSVQGELAVRGWNAQLRGVLGRDEYGGSMDLSRVVKRGDQVSYGVAMHLGMSHSDWLPEHPILTNRTIFQASLGPSIMLRGITASSQLGVATDGRETLQIVSTRISANGNLMSVRHPVTVTAVKTFAFGGGPIVSRRREHAEELTAAVQLVEDFSVKVGLSSTRIAWPSDRPADDLRGSETLIRLGGEYGISW